MIHIPVGALRYHNSAARSVVLVPAVLAASERCVPHIRDHVAEASRAHPRSARMQNRGGGACSHFKGMRSHTHRF